VVERVAPLHDTVGEAHRERAVARIQVEALGLAVQRPVGVRAALEHAPDDCDRARARGRDPRRGPDSA
jgi:hypothetical protein